MRTGDTLIGCLDIDQGYTIAFLGLEERTNIYPTRRLDMRHDGLSAFTPYSDSLSRGCGLNTFHTSCMSFRDFVELTDAEAVTMNQELLSDSKVSKQRKANIAKANRFAYNKSP